jgi:hypothetical protein
LAVIFNNIEKKMLLNDIIKLPFSQSAETNKIADIAVTDSLTIQVYPKSVIDSESGVLFIGREGIDKSLFILLKGNSNDYLFNQLTGKVIDLTDKTLKLKKCPLIHANAKLISDNFEFAKASVQGNHNSIGMGDRIGLANAGHIRALKGFAFRPILAQQSIRELTRTQRTPDEVEDAAIWAVIQEGWKEGFGSDADHLKSTEDIDLMVKYGFKMFTFDPGEHVQNDADSIDEKELDKKIAGLNWSGMNSDYKTLSESYLGKTIEISKDLIFKPEEIQLKRALVKYGNALAHIKMMNDYLCKTYPDYESEVEVSVDETDSVTTPFEHYFIANELNRLGVKYVSLAPRFIGDFEKGIDFKGDIDLFRQEYIKHLAITKFFGSYKISLHSGSDKFAVYKVIGSLKDAYTHVKTAGTSYLEALRVLAACEPQLFREILDFARGLYETEKKTYHVSAKLSNVKRGNDYSDQELVGLFDSNDTRQVLHVTFGKVLTEKKTDGSYLFKNRILDGLKRNEDLHYEYLEKHFRRHLEPFGNE